MVARLSIDRGGSGRKRSLVVRALVAGAVGVVVAAAMVMIPSANAAAGVNEIVGAQSGRCIDVPNATHDNGTRVRLYDCNGQSNQQWVYTSSKQLQVYGNKCLDAYSRGTANGTAIIIWDCNGGANQQWNVNSNGTITGVQSGRCLDVWGTANEQQVQLYDCWGGANQQFKLVSLGGPTSPPPSSPPVSPSSSSSTPPRAHSMGFIGCSMGENVAQGYVADGGTRMWGPYGTGGLVVQSWTDPNSAAWQKFDQQAAQYGRPAAVWVQICIFASSGATYNEVKQLIANARQHAASGAAIIITGQPLYPEGNVCQLAGNGGPELTDRLAQQAAADTTQNVTYPGHFTLRNSEVADGCHANTTGQASLGRQALAFWG